MTTSSSKDSNKTEWLVIIPDLPGAKGRRSTWFPQHCERMKLDPQDFWVFGGATLKDCVTLGQAPDVSGSAMMVFTTSREHILARLEEDPLVKGKVWDLENAQITPFFRPKRGAI